MLYPEEPTDSIIRIVGIDPGTTTLGLAILDVDLDTLVPTLVYGYTNNAEKATKHIEWKKTMLGSRDVRLENHKDYLDDILEYTQPILIAAESPFLKMSRVSSYEALVECYDMIRKSVWKHNPTLFLRRIDPITVKNYVGVSHIGTDKEDVRKAVIARYANLCHPSVDIHSLDEHTIDAVAVAHCVLEKHLKELHIETTKKPKRRRGGRSKRRSKK